MTENRGPFSNPGGVTDALGGVTDSLGNLVNGIIKAGPGGTITQDMVNQANEVKPAVDKANG
ncbi:hypothetical protein ACFWAT_31950 [Streptomyces syringium]|uniref:hypothetical protein n=1 Tax=Streptomyces syringium TaxID=76729 RepID=UPI00365AC062